MEEKKPQTARHPRVLVAQNCSENARRIRYCLSALNSKWEIIDAATGAEALEHLREARLCAAVLDMRLPDMTALDLMSSVGYRCRQTSIIVTVEHSDLSQAAELVQQGAYVIVVKQGDTHLTTLPPIVAAACEHSQLVRERDRLDDENRRARDFLVGLIEHSANAIVVLDTDGNVTLFNPSASELTGYQPGNILGRPVLELVAPEARPDLRALLDATDCEGLSMEFDLRGPDGRTVPADVSFSFTRDVEGAATGCLLVMQDIRERRRLEEERLNTERLNAIIATAIAANHKINNPLAVIMGHVALLRMNEELDHSVRERLEEVQKAAYRIEAVTTKLATLGRAQFTDYAGTTRVMVDLDSQDEGAGGLRRGVL